MGIKPKRTRPYRPRTNGKIERFHRTMADGWAFRRMFLSELARRQALPAWLHEYNRRVRHDEPANPVSAAVTRRRPAGPTLADLRSASLRSPDTPGRVG
jgi:transposase